MNLRFLLPLAAALLAGAGCDVPPRPAESACHQPANGTGEYATPCEPAPACRPAAAACARDADCCSGGCYSNRNYGATCARYPWSEEGGI